MRGRSRWHGSTVAVAAALLAACGGGSTERPFGREDVAAIRQLIDGFVAAYNAKDADKAVSYFSGAATLMPPNSSAVHGPESIKGYYEIRFGQGATDLQVEPGEIQGSGTLAYIVGTYSLRLASEGGPETRDRGKFVWIARNMPGNNWRFEVHIWSSDLPPPTPPPTGAETE